MVYISQFLKSDKSLDNKRSLFEEHKGVKELIARYLIF